MSCCLSQGCASQY